MAGINRLGKAPPRPGSLRPPDPNKYRTMDMYSEGGENDADYMRMVQDIEDTQQNHVGWLFGRGAFDKGDLLYLRDEEEKRRFLEKDQRESERSQFLAMRAREMAERDASLPEAPRPSRDRPLIRPKQMAAVIRVQPGQTTVRLGVSQGIAAHSSQEPAAKRHKAEAAGEKSHIQATPLSQAAPLPQTSQAASAQEVSLEGLLGGYGSDSADEADGVAHKSEAQLGSSMKPENPSSVEAKPTLIQPPERG